MGIITGFRWIGLTDPGSYPVGMSADLARETGASPVLVMTTGDTPVLNSGNGPIIVSGALITYGSAQGSTGTITVAPPVSMADPILLAPPPSWVVVNGTAQEGQTLSATTSSEFVSAQWQKLIGGSWVNLQGAAASVYNVQPDDVGRQIRIQITRTDGLSVTSSATNAVLDAVGNQYVYEMANATTIESGLLQYVYGTAVGTTVNAGGEQNIYFDGLATANILNAGGIQIDWGHAEATAVSGGTQIVWGTANHTTISGGLQIVESGGLASDTEIYPGGEQAVFAGGHASNTTVGGTQTVYGSADTTTVGFGGLQRVHGQVSTTTVHANSQQNVYADGTATDTTLYEGSVQIDWGIATYTIVGMNSTQYVWGVAIDTTLQQSSLGGAGDQYVEAGGSAHGTQIGAYSTQYVHAGGTSSVTFVGSLGHQVVYGSDADATIFGGTQDVWGIATNATVVSSAGVQNVLAGGLARNSTIEGFATVHVFAGGALDNVTFRGASVGLVLDEGSSFTGSISGWNSFGMIDLGGIQFADGTTLGYAASSDQSGGILTVSDGTHAAALSLLGQYTAADFAIASDGHGGTSVYDPVSLPAMTITPPAA